MLATEQLLGLRALGGLYQPLRAGELRPRGAVLDDVDAGGALYDERPSQRRRTCGRWSRRSCARPCAAAAELDAGALEPRPATCSYEGGCSHPAICRVAGAMSAAPSFTAEQRDAIDRRGGPLALAANAGSGKTSVLVERYVRAVIEDGIAPGRILAITFTDRAAGELRERVRRRLAAAGEREAARASAGAFISTFHGFCARLLRTHAVLAGLTPDFTVLDESQAQTLRDSAFDHALAGWLEDGEALELAGRFSVAGLREAIGSVYDELRSRGERTPSLPAPVARHDRRAAAAALAATVAAVRVELAAAPGSAKVERALERLERSAELAGADEPPSPAELDDLCLGNGSRALAGPACEAYERARTAFAEACADELGVPAVELLDRLLGAFGRRYEVLKRVRGALDFDDLELDAGRLLAEHRQLAALWSERFELLMVDELQDTNPRQMALLQALERDNLFTVGDEFQSIYGFRHADVGLFRDRREQLATVGAAKVLSTNFRSRPPLLDAVNGVFAPRFGEPFVPLVPGRSEEADWLPGAARVELLLVDADGWDEHEAALGVELAPAPLWRRAEARLLAARLEALIASGEARAEDVVLLFRAGTAIATYEAALADRGLATLATAGGGFFARPEIVDLVAYVRALANPPRRAGALRGARLAAVRLLLRHARRAGAALSRARRRHLGGAARRAPGRAGRRLRRALRGCASRRRRPRPWRDRRRRGQLRTATTSTSARCTRRSGGWPTSTSWNAWRATSRRARGATCGVSRRRSPRAAWARCARPRRHRPPTAPARSR